MNNFLNTINNVKKEKLVKFGTVSLALLFVFYLYLLGALVGANTYEKHLLGVLDAELQKLYEAESLFMAEGKSLHLSFFKELGYEEPKKFDLIRPSANVAGIVQSSIQ